MKHEATMIDGTKLYRSLQNGKLFYSLNGNTICSGTDSVKMISDSFAAIVGNIPHQESVIIVTR